MTWLRALYDWTMEKAAHPWAQGWLAFFCFIEASFFPIPPHPLLGLMCLAEPQKALRFGLIATIASVIGGLFGYMIGFFLFEAVGEWLIAAMGMSDALPIVRCRVEQDGAWVVFIAAFTPLPFKLATILAGFLEMPITSFLLAAVLGRAGIFVTVGLLFRVFGAPIKRIIDKYLGLLTSLFVVLLLGGVLAFTQLAPGNEETDTLNASCNVTAEVE